MRKAVSRRRASVSSSYGRVIEMLERRYLLVAPIFSDQTLSGTIGVAGEVDEYTFEASVGDSIIAFVAETGTPGNFAPAIALVAPDATVLINDLGNLGADIIRESLPQAGTYTLRVSDAGDNDTGAYAVTLAHAPAFQFPGSDGVLLTSGPRFNGTIGVGDLDVFRIQAETGDNVILSIADTGNTNFQPHFYVYGPSGGNEVTQDLGVLAADASFQATVDGTYYVIVKDWTNDNVGGGFDGDVDTGTYALTMAHLPANQTDDAGDGGLLTSGPRKRGIITLGDLDVFRIEANAGDAVILSIADPDGAPFQTEMRVFGPGGEPVESDLGDVGADLFFSATVGGTYYVVVKDFYNDNVGSGFDGDVHTGEYALTMAKLPDVHTDDAGEGGPLATGARVVGRLALGDIDVYELALDVGDSLVGVVRSLERGVYEAQALLYSPNGTLVDSSNGSTNSLVSTESVALGGTYYLVVKDAFNDNIGGGFDGDVEAGEYALTFVIVPSAAQPVDPDSGALVSGQARAGAVSGGDLDVYTFAVTAGVPFTVNLAESGASGFDPNFRVYDPDGTLLALQTATFTLANPTVAGTYTLVVSDDVGDESGPYSIALDAPAGADNFAPRALHVEYRFDAAQAELRVIFSEDVGASFSGADVAITNLDTGQPVLAGQLAVAYQANSDLFRVTFPPFPNRVLPDGNYRMSVLAGNVTDPAGNPLTGDVTLDFFTLGGDANRDRNVNLADFNILAINFGKASKVFSQGDFNYDGQVTLADFNILATRFGRSVAPDAAPRRNDAGSIFDDTGKGAGDDDDDALGALFG